MTFSIAALTVISSSVANVVGLYLLHFVGKLLSGLAVLPGHWWEPAWREEREKQTSLQTAVAAVLPSAGLGEANG